MRNLSVVCERVAAPRNALSRDGSRFESVVPDNQHAIAMICDSGTDRIFVLVLRDGPSGGKALFLIELVAKKAQGLSEYSETASDALLVGQSICWDAGDADADEDESQILSLPVLSEGRNGGVVGSAFLDEHSAVFIALASGEMICVNVGTNEGDSTMTADDGFAFSDLQLEYRVPEIVGRADEGLVAVGWSPDANILVCLCGNGSIMTLTNEFDMLRQTDELALLRGLDDGAISWRGDGEYFTLSGRSNSGSAHVLVFDREGEHVSTVEVPNENEVAAPVSWRPAGNLIATTSVRRAEHTTVCIMCERNGLPLHEFALPSWDGEVEQYSVAFVSWSARSEVLTIAMRPLVPNLAWVVQSWVRSNAQYDLKHSFVSPIDAVSSLQWDNEVGLRQYILLASGAVIVTDFDLSYTVHAPLNEADESLLAVCVDHSKLRCTPLSRTCVPPPMSLWELRASRPVHSVFFASSRALTAANGILDRVDHVNVCALASDQNSLFIFASPLATCKGALEIDIRSWFSGNFRVSHLQSVQLDSSSSPLEFTFFGVASFPSYDEIFVATTSGGKTKELRTSKLSNRVTALTLTDRDAQQGFIQMGDNSLFLVQLTDLRLQLVSQLPVRCPSLQFVSTNQGPFVVAHDTTRNRLFVSVLSAGSDRSLHLVETLLVSTECTSFASHCNYLMLTVHSNVLQFVPWTRLRELKSGSSHSVSAGQSTSSIPMLASNVSVDSRRSIKFDEDVRELEDRAVIVCASTGSRSSDAADAKVYNPRTDPRVVLQMPRGNLETIFPRPLLWSRCRELLETNFDFCTAFSLTRRHKIDCNVLTDFFYFSSASNRRLFLSRPCIERIILELSSASSGAVGATGHSQDFLTLWLNSISATDASLANFANVEQGRYPADVGEGGILHRIFAAELEGAAAVSADENTPKAKLNTILQAASAVLLDLEKPGESKFMLPYLTTLVRQDPPLLVDAIRYIQSFRLNDKSEQKLHPRDNADSIVDLDAEEEAQAPREDTKNRDLADSAIEFLCWLVDPDLVYDCALGVYDFELCTAIAQHTNKDPRTYLPLFQHWKSELQRTGNARYVHGLVDLHLNKTRSAVEKFFAAGSSVLTPKRKPVLVPAAPPAGSRPSLIPALFTSVGLEPEAQHDEPLNTALDAWKRALRLCESEPGLLDAACRLWSFSTSRSLVFQTDPLLISLLVRRAQWLQTEKAQPFEAALIFLQAGSTEEATRSFVETIRASSSSGGSRSPLPNVAWRLCMASAVARYRHVPARSSSETAGPSSANAEVSVVGVVDADDEDFETSFQMDFSSSDAAIEAQSSDRLTVFSIASMLAEALATEGYHGEAGRCILEYGAGGDQTQIKQGIRWLMQAGEWCDAVRYASIPADSSVAHESWRDEVFSTVVSGAIQQARVSCASLDERRETIKQHTDRLRELRETALRDGIGATTVGGGGLDNDNDMGMFPDNDDQSDMQSVSTASSAMSFGSVSTSSSSASSLQSFVQSQAGRGSDNRTAGYSGHTTLENLPDARRAARRTRRVREKQLRRREKARFRRGVAHEEEYLVNAVKVLLPTTAQKRQWNELITVLTAFGHSSRASKLQQAARSLEDICKEIAPLLFPLKDLLGPPATILFSHHHQWLLVQQALGPSHALLADPPALPTAAAVLEGRLRESIVRAAQTSVLGEPYPWELHFE